MGTELISTELLTWTGELSVGIPIIFSIRLGSPASNLTEAVAVLRADARPCLFELC